MTANITKPYGSGFHTDQQVPPQVYRRGLVRPVHKVRVCHDGRNYVSVPFTIPGQVGVLDYSPEWKADRDYWIARVTAVIGRHSTATHPNDGTPGGSDLLVNMRRIDAANPSDDQAILNNDARLRIPADHHVDAVNDTQDGKFSTDDFNLHRLAENDQPYVRVTQVGSSRPGTGLVVTLVLVPIP